MSTDAEYFDMTAAPMRIGTVRLKVRNLDAVAAYYEDVLGLSRMMADARHVTLGTGETPLLRLDGDPDLASRDPRQAGLFHVAFLMSRPDLARWLQHVADARVPLQGASDHIVSEAIYLADPEGNGIEVYADRPSKQWRDTSGKIRMATDPLDIDALMLAKGEARWNGFPTYGSIGHVHLQVGDTGEADRFYSDVLGFDIMARYPGASFYGSGGYHHQLAGNIWSSRRAGKRPERMTGLDAVEIVIRDGRELAAIGARAKSAGIASIENADGLTLHDPWGTALTLKN